ncbi:SDR family oxidoreductase [Hydromonas duriensis]|uniref:Nucleoside-diphosphate-sugar epimerase n=1 Tax=Hydromonas duriensis TaxID=1527608 RepID=A0A4R6Y6T5_9BURK|nr:SDR family oxidoreductase [Hydromonas duriensis]TDR27843.1 nucleoside-diphosphate-sugar epimerase [Hydromonas duriensis]
MNTHQIHLNKLLIIGLGDVARRALPALERDWRVWATQRQIVPLKKVTSIVCDLDDANFDMLPKSAQAVLYTAPPPHVGRCDTRLAALLSHWLAHGGAPRHLVYISTSGVYGDCAGAWVDETCPLNPESERAVRRADAERQLMDFAKRHGMTLTILRAPGIYSLERLPLERLRRGLPVLNEDEDGFSNHIHADDLAMMCVAALAQPSGIKVYNASDDLPLKMGDWFCLLAKAAGLPAPPRMERTALEAALPPMQWSFVRESRRLSNEKIKNELAVRLRYPSVKHFLEMNMPLTIEDIKNK